MIDHLDQTLDRYAFLLHMAIQTMPLTAQLTSHVQLSRQLHEFPATLALHQNGRSLSASHSVDRRE